MKKLIFLFSALGCNSAFSHDFCDQYKCTEIRTVTKSALKETHSLKCAKPSEPLLYIELTAVDAKGAVIDGMPGYSTRFYNSDFRCATIKNIYGGDWTFNGSDFRFADLSGIHLDEGLVSVYFKGAFFNHFTKLPFSKKEALERGMLYKD